MDVITVDGVRREPGLSQFQASMFDIVSRGRRIDIRAYEIASVDHIVAELQPPTLELLREARRLLGEILDRCHQLAPDWIGGEQPSPAWSSYLPFEHAIDATMEKIGSHQAVDEIAFIAQLELRQREERLERVRAAQGSATLLGECDSSLRRLCKALTAVDAAISKVEAVPPQLAFTSELQSSLAVRRSYAKIRARITADGEPTPAKLRTWFRRAGTQIAIVVGWDVYPEMRVSDRLLLRDLQQRMLAWLREGDEASVATGVRLWQDLAGCMEMFSLVNRRQELVEHDGALVRDLVDQLRAGTPPEDAWTKLHELEGLDAELDACLAERPTDPGALRAILSRLAAQLTSAAEPSPGEGNSPW